MKDRQKKKAEKRKRELIHEMLDAVLDINGLDERVQYVTGNLPTAFFEFCGHVGAVQARLNRNGWKSGEISVHSPTAHTNDVTELMATLRWLKAETPGAATPRESRGN